jgi:hypothetical protein
VKFIHWIGVGVLVVAAFVAISRWLNRTQHESPETGPEMADSGNRSATRRVTQSSPPAHRSPIQTQAPQEPVTLGTALYGVKTRGDFGPLKRVLMGMKPSERHLFLWADLVDLKSPLGTGHDYRESLAIIKELGGNSSATLLNGLARKTGMRLVPATDKDFVTSLDPDSWKAMIAGAVGVNASKGFELALADWGERHQRIACAEATRIWLDKDSLAVSKRLSQMPNGAVKDVAICEMVDWLVGRNSGEQATAWIADISDPAQREEMRKRILER